MELSAKLLIIKPNNSINQAQFAIGFQAGRVQTQQFINLYILACPYYFVGNVNRLVRPNYRSVVDPEAPQVVVGVESNPLSTPATYTRPNSQFATPSPGHDPRCAAFLDEDLIKIADIICERITQEYNSPMSTGFSLSYWIGFSAGYQTAF